MIDYNDLEQFLSRERLDKYLVLANDNEEEAIRLYKLNLKISAKMYILLSCFEVLFRNIINNSIITYDCDWINNLKHLHEKMTNDFNKYQQLSKSKSTDGINKFFDTQNEFIQRTENDLIKENKNITTNYLVSRLNFAFWENLLSKNYESFIWNKFLKKVFKTSRGSLQKDINELRRLRNRVTHNECILSYNIEDVKDKIFNISSQVDIKLIDVIKEMSQDL